jgi:hypothetical protein
MRSDLIAAAMIRTWLDNNAPHMINGWDFQMTDDLAGFVTRLKTLMSDIDAQFVAQAAIARTAIEHWKIEHVAVLGGGMPTPLAPRPEQVRYFTDSHPEVVAEVQQMGYPAVQVDVRDPQQLKQLDGAQVAIATGLFHFLNDETVTGLLTALLDSPFQQIIFNNMNRNVTDVVLENWTRLGYTLYRRNPEEMNALLPPDWRMASATSVPEFLSHNPDLGVELSRLNNWNDIYRITRD